MQSEISALLNMDDAYSTFMDDAYSIIRTIRIKQVEFITFHFTTFYINLCLELL